ncbi:murein biosynthesis integral membrane protein MurJ [uncultured Ilyobacter sp.]|uniref:murein biosynthesis integral membrane protein MurJ n=1 Tax=uncultured Ilyobacter sp. TaxID=544433 RepID=UPI0029C8BCB6|nr:murein biosynthesis integral membrane protein MurJ [uncultured Ilyobacter sp.]
MFRSGMLVMVITMASRILGLVRTAMIAYYFGASKFTDAYFSAFKISNLFRQLLGEGALGTVFIPVYNERVAKHGEEAGKQLIFSILNLLFVGTSIITLCMIVFSGQIINIIVMGYPAETKLIASRLLKIMAIYLVFIGMSGMICAVLNNFKQFAVPAATSLLFNIAIIVSAVFWGKSVGIDALAAGVVVGGILQLLMVIPSFFKIIKKYEFKIDFKDPSLRRVFYLILPMLLGIFAKQINSVVDQFFASYLKSGGVTALENASRLYNLPLGVFGISIATVIYPSMSRAIERKAFDEMRDRLSKGLNILMFLIIPSIAVLTVYSKDVISLVFSYGKYDGDAVIVTSQSLLYYSLGLYFYTAIHLLSRAFYGMKNTRDPVKYSIVSIVLNIILNALLIQKLQHRGLALATSIASGVNFFLLVHYFKKKYIGVDLKKMGNFLMKILVSTVAAISLSYFIEIVLIKLLVFSVVYLAPWLMPLKRRGIDVF